MKGRQNSPMGNDSVEEVLDAFKDFCRRHSKRAMNPNTLRRYEQVIDVQSKKYGFLLDRADFEHIERIVTVVSAMLTGRRGRTPAGGRSLATCAQVHVAVEEPPVRINYSLVKHPSLSFRREIRRKPRPRFGTTLPLEYFVEEWED